MQVPAQLIEHTSLLDKLEIRGELWVIKDTNDQVARVPLTRLGIVHFSEVSQLIHDCTLVLLLVLIINKERAYIDECYFTLLEGSL